MEALFNPNLYTLASEFLVSHRKYVTYVFLR